MLNSRGEAPSSALYAEEVMDAIRRRVRDNPWPVDETIDGVGMTDFHSVHRLLYANVADGLMLTTWTSVLLEMTDPQMDPIFNFLKTQCFEMVSDRVHKDDFMYHCKARFTVYNLYPVCPGFKHSCKNGKVFERTLFPMRG